MLRGMSARQFMKWRIYAGLNPFGEEREDVRNASIVSTLVNINRDSKKRPQPYPMEMFIIPFGDHKPAPRQQSWQEMKAIAQLASRAFSE